MKQKNKIAVLAPYKIFPAKMGGQKCIALFYNYLGRLEEVTIFSTKNNEPPPADASYKFISLLGNSITRYMNPLLFFSFKKIIRKEQFTHFIIEHPYFGWLGLLLKKNCGVKLAVHSHNIESIRFKSIGKWWWRILWRYEKYIHRHSDINFFITDEDREFAISNFSLDISKCHTITYGCEMQSAPAVAQQQHSRKWLEEKHGIGQQEKIILFNGTLDYKPNVDAIERIIDSINPALMAKTGFTYKIIICGKSLPASFNGLQHQLQNNIIYAGFVDDINIYFYGADIFINPVTDGGGIKTKLIEALTADLCCITTRSGATGVPSVVTGKKMLVTEDDDWKSFADAIFAADISAHIPAVFFEHFYWGNIAAKAATIID